MEIRIIVFAAFFTLCSFSFGQVNRYDSEQVNSYIEPGIVTTIDTLQVKKRIEEGIKKKGKENINQVLVEMLYDDLKKMADKQAPNPMDVLYDKMIQDLSDEAQGKQNNAVEKYSKAFADSLMQKLYYEYNLGKRESKYKAFALNLISAAFCKSCITKNPNHIITAYNNVLLFRNYDIYNQIAIREYHKRNPFLHEYYIKYYNSLDSLNYSSNQDAYTRCCWELDVENFGSYPFIDKNPVPMFSDIKKCIPNSSTLIEFCDIYISGKKYMCACVIKDKSVAPDIVVFNVSDSLKASIINTQDSKNINNLYESDQLYKTFIEPLLPYIQGKKLYIAPSSYISFVNFSAIKNGNERLSSKYRIARLFSGADLVGRNDSDPIKDAALFGNIKYNMTPNELAQESSRYVVMRSSERRNLSSLPNSLTEIKQISSILKLSKDLKVKTKYYLAKDASEALFKSFDGNSPELIHLATHGYYLDANDRFKHTYFKDNEYNSSMMLFNGLLLSGATLAWNNNIPTPGVEDGILTSEEIARMDLSETKLVVMSACCTALGDFNEIEGVFGLQRAFKQAGVQYQISTLWPVRDDVACSFMVSYYRNYVKTKSIHKAYNLALVETQSVYSNPYYWAAFILLGN